MVSLGHLLAMPAALNERAPPLMASVDENCTRTGQAIGVQDQCDVYSALLDTYMDRAIDGDPRAAFMVGLVYMDEDAFSARSVEWFKRAADGGAEERPWLAQMKMALGTPD